MHPLCFLLFLFSRIFSECDIGGTWSTWLLSPNQTGYDYCGSSWQANWVRKCLSAPECPCNGPTEFVGEMNTGVCLFPRSGCYLGYLKSVYNRLYYSCVNNVTGSIATPPINETTLPNDTYCPPSGVGIWSSWSEWQNGCSATCGQFGIKRRTRNCTSEAYGCPCYASDIGPCQTAPCPANPCSASPVCKGPLVSSYDGSETYCYPFEATPPIGTWSDWTDAPGATCSDTCGMYGLINRTRQCFPSGSVCTGEFESMRPCPPDICFTPRVACNTGFKMTMNEEWECKEI